MPIEEKFVYIRKIECLDGGWIQLFGIHYKSFNGREAMILDTDQGQFYATSYIEKQLRDAKDVKGFYAVSSLPLTPGYTQAMCCLHNIPPQRTYGTHTTRVKRTLDSISETESTFTPPSEPLA